MGRRDEGKVRRYDLAWLVATMAIVAGLLWMAAMRQSHALVNTFDTGLYMQLLYRLGHAGDAWSSVTGEANFFAHHFQPLILILVPFFKLMPAATTLFGASALAVIACLVFWWRRLPRQMAPLLLLLAFLCHPAVAGRIYYGFVPEVLALPALAYLAWQMGRGEEIRARDVWLCALACLWAGLSKENVWLVNAWVMMILAVLVGRWRVAFSALAVVNVAIFCALFFWWMPAHSNYSHYYGLGFFGDGSGHTPWWQVLANAWSWRSVSTLMLQAILLTGGLIVFVPPRYLLACVPGAAMILFASAPHLHHPGNHYPLLYLPFLWTGLLVAVPTRLNTRFVHWPALVLCLTAGFTLAYGEACLLDSLAKIRSMPSLAATPKDVTTIRQEIGPQETLLTQDNLQPLFFDYDDVTTIVVYTGNPKALSPQYLGSVKHVVTNIDVKSIMDCHEAVAKLRENLSFDGGNFLSFCQWLKARSSTPPRYYDASGLFHYRL